VAITGATGATNLYCHDKR